MATLEQINSSEFRFYRYDPEDGSPPSDLLSVTTVRHLCGEGFQLVAWKLANIADAALGTMKRTVIGPRGGVKEVRQVFEFPSEFAVKYAASEGKQDQIDLLRKWLRESAEEPRNVAAARGTMVHEAIEKNVAWDRIERPYVESAFASLSNKDRKRIKRAVSDEDVSFVRNSVRHYWDMRATMPMTIIAREIRVMNLTAGYAGTFDALVWLLGTFGPDGEFVPMDTDGVFEARKVRSSQVTLQTIKQFGGTLVLLDWKTSKSIQTDQVEQAHAYLAAEFAFIDGKRDTRITDLLNAAMYGGLAHIRPNGWGLHCFPYSDEMVRGFLGSVAFARVLAKYPEPEAIFTHTFRGESQESDEEVVG